MGIQEIERAIRELRPDEVDDLSDWLINYRRQPNGQSILDLAGTISKSDLKLMSEAIEESCETIEHGSWQ